MRRILTGFALAALIAAIPSLARADNQQMANKIAQRLRENKQLSNYRIGVKYQSGTVWLRGRVSNEEQMEAIMKLAFQTPGVSSVVNELTLDGPDGGQSAPSKATYSPSHSKPVERSLQVSVQNPLRGRDAQSVAQRTQQPSKGSLAKRLEAIMARGEERDASAHADPLPSSFGSGTVRRVSAEEWQQVPHPMAAPQRARPMTPTYAAMTQSGTRGTAGRSGGPLPMYTAAANQSGVAPARYDQPCMPNYAWPSYAAYPNYAAVTYPKQYSPTAWPYIGPFYPYPQVPLGWRKVTLEWDDGWWFLDFKDQPASCWHR